MENNNQKKPANCEDTTALGHTVQLPLKQARPVNYVLAGEYTSELMQRCLQHSFTLEEKKIQTTKSMLERLDYIFWQKKNMNRHKEAEDAV